MPVGLKVESAVFKLIKSFILPVLGSKVIIFCPIVRPITVPILGPNDELAAVRWVCGARVPNSAISAFPSSPKPVLLSYTTCVKSAPTSTTASGFCTGG